MQQKIIYHRHHIIPRHMGGTDDLSNIIKLTIEEHVNAHKLLYEKYGKIEDRLAWQGLSGPTPNDQFGQRIRSVRVKITCFE